jgi:hypothetical protein
MRAVGFMAKVSQILAMPLASAYFRRDAIEFRGIWPYSKEADEFVRLSCRGYAGWRRDEWAQSPLFIWRKLLAKLAAVGTVFARFSGQKVAIRAALSRAFCGVW